MAVADAQRRRVCFVTGTRAEFGLMRSTLEAIRAHPSLQLQIIATGMHLSKAHGQTIRSIRDQGWKIDATVPWKSDESEAGNAMATGRAMAGISAALVKLKSDIVLVVGDRVEAFAAAAAGHVSGLIVGHVHGGDRALGQVDDALRHAITKLAHLHFPATVESERRILNLGEERWRVRRVGSPGVDGIVAAADKSVAGLPRGKFAVLVLHPTGTDEGIEFDRASMVLAAICKVGFAKIVIVYPNNDPGSAGIIRCWEKVLHSTGRNAGHRTAASIDGAKIKGDIPIFSDFKNRNVPFIVASVERRTKFEPKLKGDIPIFSEGKNRNVPFTVAAENRNVPFIAASGVGEGLVFWRDVPRSLFLALMRDAAVLVGNSSSGIIEAASFGTPVIDVGSRQQGRERSANVTNVPFSPRRLQRQLRRIWNSGEPIRYPRNNVYGGDGAGRRIAEILAKVEINDRLRRKLIAY